jgi:hypothetical protein
MAASDKTLVTKTSPRRMVTSLAISVIYGESSRVVENRLVAALSET